VRVERQRWKAEMAGEMAMRGAGLMMAVREGSEIGEPWAHGCQEEEKSGTIPPSGV
jgi:hypothetical protein